MAEIKMSSSCAGKVTGETSTLLHPSWRKTDVYQDTKKTDEGAGGRLAPRKSPHFKRRMLNKSLNVTKDPLLRVFFVFVKCMTLLFVF